MQPLLVITTVGSADDARRLARTAVERRLAACAQIGEIESVYVWQGELQQQPEWRITFKTTDARRDALERLLVELHPYELPAIHAVALSAVHPPYAQWIVDSTG